MQHRSDVEAADALKNTFQQIRTEIGKVIIGQDDVVKSVLISIFSNGHCLLVGVPAWPKRCWYKP
jgi:MoxR-like ATPase